MAAVDRQAGAIVLEWVAQLAVIRLRCSVIGMPSSSVTVAIARGWPSARRSATQQHGWSVAAVTSEDRGVTRIDELACKSLEHEHQYPGAWRLLGRSVRRFAAVYRNARRDLSGGL